MISSLEEAARSRLSTDVYDYVAGGSGEEETLGDNVEAWRRLRLHPRVLRDVTEVDCSTTLLGTPVSMPVGVAPAGYHGLLHPQGEVASAQGASRAGALTVLSSRCSSRIEDVAAVGGPWWFQPYVMKDQGLTDALVDRAVAAGARALVLTADAPRLGARRRNRDNSLVSREMFTVNTGPINEPDRAEQSARVTFEDIGRLAGRSGLPVVVKGVLRSDDAQACVSAGASAIWVSNHGGRQLDGAVATADALAAVVAGVQGTADVYVDGGVRTGLDVLKALALGADCAFVARPTLWALAVDGGSGVQRCLEQIRSELVLAMTLSGVSDLASLREAGLADRRR